MSRSERVIVSLLSHADASVDIASHALEALEQFCRKQRSGEPIDDDDIATVLSYVPVTRERLVQVKKSLADMRQKVGVPSQ
jgi:hypothetical protein